MSLTNLTSFNLPPGLSSSPGPNLPLGSMTAPSPLSTGSAMPGLPTAAIPPVMNPYIYDASFSMAIFACIGFLLLAIWQSALLFRYRAWYFNLVPQAALIGAAGMIARTHSILHLKDMTAFAAAMLATQIPSSLLTFGNLFTFTRLMWWVTPNIKRNAQTLLLPPKHLSLLWGLAFMVGEAAKSVGSTMRTNPVAHRVQNIGVVYQVFVLAAFAGYSFRFMQMSRSWLLEGQAELRDWRKLGWTVTLVSAILILRAVYLVAEFDGQPTPTTRDLAFVASHEWLFWVGNQIPVLLVLLLYSVNHPGAHLPPAFMRFRWKVAEVEALKAAYRPPMASTVVSQEEMAIIKPGLGRIQQVEFVEVK